MSDNIQPNNHYPMYDFFKTGDTHVEKVERSRSVNTPAPAADVGWQIDQMNDNFAAASASASASAADSGRPTNAAAADAITTVANNANNAIVSVADKAIAALANTDKVAASQDGTVTRKREHKIPVLEDEGCSKSKKVKQEASEYKAK